MGIRGWIVFLSLMTLLASARPLSEKRPTDLLTQLLEKSTVYNQGQIFTWRSERKATGLWCRNTDTKGDGKPHSIDCFSKNRLVLRERDRNGDGKMDEFTSYGTDEKIVRQIDSHFDGNLDVEETLVREGPYIVRTTRRAKGKKPVIWAVVSVEHYPLAQEEGKAGHDGAEEEALKAMQATEGLRPLAKPFEAPSDDGKNVTTKFGFQVAKDCLDTDAKLAERLHETLAEGVKCLIKLDDEGKNHVSKIASLLLGQPSPRLMCTLEGQKWGRREALSSLPPEPPWIAVNPTFLAAATPQTMKQTLFHELFHPLGYAHQSDVDYPYACSFCCFPSEAKTDAEKKKQPLITDLACKICGAHFEGGVDNLDYLKKMAAFLPKILKAHHGTRPLLQYLKKHKGEPEEREAEFALVRSLSGVFEAPVASALLNRLEPVTDKGEMALLNLVRFYDKKPWAPQYASASKRLVSAVDAWTEGNDDEAARLIRESSYPSRNDPQLKDIDPGILDAVETSLNRTRLAVAELIYDSYGTQGAKVKEERFQTEVLEPLARRVSGL